MAHPDVAEAAVVGVPSDLSEEDVKAFVVLGDGADGDLAAFRDCAAERLARFKVPRYVEVVDELPHTPTGRSPSTSCRASAPSGETDFEATTTGGRMSDETGCAPASAPPTRTRSRSAGRDLASELMGQVSFTELTFLLVARPPAEPEETRLLDAVLVSLADHGLTPTVLAARLTYTGAPESLQGAVAAGLLGAGTVFLGVVEDTARSWRRSSRTGRRAGRRGAAPPRRRRRCASGSTRAAACPASGTRSTRPRTRARRACTRSPRRPACSGRTCALLRLVAEAHASRHRQIAADQRRRRGRRGARRPGLPAGAHARVRARRAHRGLVGHLAEEMAQPLGMPLYQRDRPAGGLRARRGPEVLRRELDRRAVGRARRGARPRVAMAAQRRGVGRRPSRPRAVRVPRASAGSRSRRCPHPPGPARGRSRPPARSPTPAR